MSSRDLDDAEERRFNEDLAKAIALSLETQELERIRSEHRKQSLEQRMEHLNIHATTALNKTETSLKLGWQLPPPPSNHKHYATNADYSRINILPPPPSSSSIKREQTVIANDLMTFQSPTKPTTSLYPNLNDLFASNNSSKESTFPTSQQITPYRDIFMPRSQSQPLPITYNDVLKVISKRDNSNLIDLSADNSYNSAVTMAESVGDSLLEIFDPYAPKKTIPVVNNVSHVDKGGGEEQGAVGGDEDDDNIYGEYNPFDYILEPPKSLYDGSDIVEYREKKQQPTDPENRRAFTPLVSKRLQVEKINVRTGGPEIEAFCDMVGDLRSGFDAHDVFTNVGLVLSPTVDCCYTENISVKLVVSIAGCAQSVVFTCNLDTNMEHVISHVVCELERRQLRNYPPPASEYVLKVAGLAEYIPFSTNTLSEYEYIHQCLKLERDVCLTLIHSSTLKRPLARTIEDDVNDVRILPYELLPSEEPSISYETLVILLETMEREMERIIKAAVELVDVSSKSHNLQYKSVYQAVKAISALMGHIETIEISQALRDFISVCESFITDSAISILNDQGPYSTVSVTTNLEKSIRGHCDGIRDAVESLVECYSKAFVVDFRVFSGISSTYRQESVIDIRDPVLFWVGTLHSLPNSWTYTQYEVEVQIFHGTRPLKPPYRSDPGTVDTSGFFKRVIFDHWFNLNDMPINMLPREARFVFVLWGLTALPPDHELSKANPGNAQCSRYELGWAAAQCFDYAGMWTTGNLLLRLWPRDVADRRLGPAPDQGSIGAGKSIAVPMLHIRVPQTDKASYFFPPVEPIIAPTYDISSLDKSLQRTLLDISELNTFARLNWTMGGTLWDKRHYMHNVPKALPKVLLLVSSWDARSLPELHGMVDAWTPMDPLAAIQLLQPAFADTYVRQTAISWIRQLSSDELTDYLPQLVEAYKYETYENNAMAKFLLERALISPRFAHYLFWILVNATTLAKNSLSNNIVVDSADYTQQTEDLAKSRYHRRFQILLNALLRVSGASMSYAFDRQRKLAQRLYEVAVSVKRCKESHRMKVLQSEFERINEQFNTNEDEKGVALPLSASIAVVGINSRTCSYFPSNTLPLKIDFLIGESESTNRIYPAIFKVGDDLQQDVLTLQMLRVMDKLWLREGLDLKMVTFACIPTGPHRGVIELVEHAETLRKIHTEHGLTGSFKDRPIAEWLAKHNAGAFEYHRAVDNFTASCAGYCVATYVLGICDRHNDNIMLKTSGHLFHIDFGKFLGDAQMFGNFKRDRAPFVLTPDMAYVINDGDRPSQKFQGFVDLCCRAFAVVRKNEEIILSLLGFMVSSGIPGVTTESMRYVQEALLPQASPAEAAATFARLIDSSLKSWFTQFNFFLHNVALQLTTSRASNTGPEPQQQEQQTLLTFVPRIHTCQEDGRITNVSVHGCQKRYETEKYYMYILRVRRINQPDDAFLFRTYPEFCELHQKICTMFPLAKIYSLPAGIHIGRSNIKYVAERRKIDIEKFLVSLFKMADEVAHSDIVYTFFHPLLRDQLESDVNTSKLKEKLVVDKSQSRLITGQIRMSIQYQRNALQVMVHHIKGLRRMASGQEPNTYVKFYLIPDPGKETKRKTRVVRKNCHPTFMEMSEYRLDRDVIRTKELKVTVWSYDHLQENEFLGGFIHPLNELQEGVEILRWFTLGNVPR